MLAGCSLTRQIAESSVSYYSREHFTLIATVPANFGFTSRARYYPKAGESCKMYSPGLGGMVTREQQKSDSTAAKDVAQTVSTRIPLEFHIADCAMELGGVSYEVSATYGTDAWDHGLEMAGGISVKAVATDYISKDDPAPIEQRGLCFWYFQISKSKAKLGEIEKILSCKAVDEQWTSHTKSYERRKPGGSIARNLLANGVVSIEFRLSPEEFPAVGDTWQHFPDGWKPCMGKGLNDPYGFCRGNTEHFRTFKRDGRECTIYPNCIEQGATNE